MAMWADGGGEKGGGGGSDDVGYKTVRVENAAPFFYVLMEV